MEKDYVEGLWFGDASDRATKHPEGRNVRFKRKWGEHVFTDEEIEKLCIGEDITFAYHGKNVTGHLQYYFYNEKKYFGFCPNFDKNYESLVYYDPEVHSRDK